MEPKFMLRCLTVLVLFLFAAMSLSGEDAFPVDPVRSLIFLGSGGGVPVLDGSKPANPSEMGALSYPELLWQVAVSGNHVFLANAGNGLRVIDVSDPNNPIEAGFYASLACPGAGSHTVELVDPAE